MLKIYISRNYILVTVLRHILHQKESRYIAVRFERYLFPNWLKNSYRCGKMKREFLLSFFSSIYGHIALGGTILVISLLDQISKHLNTYEAGPRVYFIANLKLDPWLAYYVMAFAFCVNM